MITIRVDVTKIDKAHLFHGKKGIYLNLILVEKANEYGDTGFCAQSIGEEKREEGERGPILGNWRDLSKANQAPPPKPKAPPPQDDDIPF